MEWSVAERPLFGRAGVRDAVDVEIVAVDGGGPRKLRRRRRLSLSLGDGHLPIPLRAEVGLVPGLDPIQFRELAEVRRVSDRLQAVVA
ncbi:hypothetical protein [Halolamina sp.]|jgi:hypothetical protein|uniref:hypothetical protein n=1 Tax=Halolamina sp. TaxID=1940283 RepID=UPI00067812A2